MWPRPALALFRLTYAEDAIDRYGTDLLRVLHWRNPEIHRAGELMAAKAAAALQLSEADARHQAEMGAERARAEAVMAAKLKAQRESLVGMAAAQLDTDALVSDAVRGALSVVRQPRPAS